MGVYVYDERALRFLPEGLCQFPDLVLRLLEAGERVAAFESDADWFDIGTMGEYERAAAEVERNPEKYDLEPLGPQQHDLPATLETPEAVSVSRCGGSSRSRPARSASAARTCAPARLTCR